MIYHEEAAPRCNSVFLEYFILDKARDGAAAGFFSVFAATHTHKNESSSLHCISIIQSTLRLIVIAPMISWSVVLSPASRKHRYVYTRRVYGAFSSRRRVLWCARVWEFYPRWYYVSISFYFYFFFNVCIRWHCAVSYPNAHGVDWFSRIGVRVHDRAIFAIVVWTFHDGNFHC